MDDYSHLRKEEGEGEHRSLLAKEESTSPEEARELLAKMRHIGNLIQEVSITSLHIKFYFREPSHF
jgi:hypothetical protein